MTGLSAPDVPNKGFSSGLCSDSCTSLCSRGATDDGLLSIQSKMFSNWSSSCIFEVNVTSCLGFLLSYV